MEVESGTTVRKRSRETEKTENPPCQEKRRNGGILKFLIEHYPWVLTMWLIPLSVFYDMYSWVQTQVTYWANQKKSSLRHEAKVENVVSQILAWRKSGSKQPMCSGRSEAKSITMQSLHYKKQSHKIYFDHMSDILSIDEANKCVRVEPCITIGNLNDFLIQRGWMLPIVPELDDLTIGGLVMGGGIESTSHKYGFFHLICRECEMALSDGRVIKASPTENQDIFAAIPVSYGTLGFLMSVEIEIVPYQPYIELTYDSVNSLEEVVSKFTEVTNDPQVDSVEGIMYTLDTGIIMSGKFVNRVPKGAKYNPIGRWYKPFFYKHAEKYLSKSKSEDNVEYIPTKDFFHRHNRSYYWMSPLPFANHWLFRILLGWTSPIKFSLLKRLHKMASSGGEFFAKNQVLQDYIMELKDLKDTLKLVDKVQRVYPIWLCPARNWNKWDLKELERQKTACFVDIGVYGESPVEGFDGVKAQREIERFAMEREGIVALYAESQLTEEEFHQMFNVEGLIENYYKLRRKLGCENAFPTIYQKVSKLGRSMQPK